MKTRRGGQSTTTENNGSNSSEKQDKADFSKNQSEANKPTSPVARMPPNQKDAPSTTSTSRRPRSIRSRQSGQTNYSRASRRKKATPPKVSTVRSIDSDTVGSNSEKYLSIPEDERKPAAVETINKNRPNPPRKGKNKTNSRSTNQKQTVYNWDLELEDYPIESDLPSRKFTLDVSFLTKRTPDGLGLSQMCRYWLDALDIKTWQDFVSIALQQSVQKLMNVLNVDGYYTHRKDLRKFICFGRAVDPKHNRSAPSCHRPREWMQYYLLQIRTDLPYFPSEERYCAEFGAYQDHSPKVDNLDPPDDRSQDHHTQSEFEGNQIPVIISVPPRLVREGG